MTDRKIKQVVLIRRDLKMPPGKLGAQVAHASRKVLIDKLEHVHPNKHGISFGNGEVARCRQIVFGGFVDGVDPIEWWIDNDMTTVCLGVKNDTELFDIYKQAKSKHLPCSIITDLGRTVFKEPTRTTVAIGPFWVDEIDKITGHLKLY